MIINKEMAEKFVEYKRLKNDINKFFNEEQLEGIKFWNIVDRAQGKLREDGTYLIQYILYEDVYEGTIYVPIENSLQYMAFKYVL